MVPVGPEHGLASESVVNCDNLFTVPKRELGSRRGSSTSRHSISFAGRFGSLSTSNELNAPAPASGR